MRAAYLEVRGFRSFGSTPQRLDLSAPLAVVHAGNNQGKSSLAEAMEFLFTGGTTRRLLLGGSPGEFEGALRNAHLAPGEPVYVEIGLADGSGNLRVLRRELTHDYRGASDCTSTLTLDGAAVGDVSAAGLVLSDPPLAAPVLLEHTLRYAVSAKPGERADYFKAVLEVADLDTVRSEVDALLAERDDAPRPPLLAALAKAATAAVFAAGLDPLRAASDGPSVEAALRGACHAAAPPDDPAAAVGEPLHASADRLRQALQARQRDVLPVADLLPPAPADTAFADPAAAPQEEPAAQLATVASTYNEQAATVDRDTAAVLPLLQAALQVDSITDIDEKQPADCPLCLTPRALTAARVAAIRGQLAEQQQLPVAASVLRGQLHALGSRAQAAAQAAARAVPRAAGWDAATRAERAAAAQRLGAEPGQTERALAAADELAAAADSTAAAWRRCEQALDALANPASRLEQLAGTDTAGAAAALRDLAVEISAVPALHTAAHGAAELLVQQVQPRLEQGSRATEWAAVADFAERPAEVAAALQEHSRRTATTARLRQAAGEIDAAVQRVLDSRLERMGDEIGRWRALLRPHELTAFDAITRRGTGRRYLDVTAALTPDLASPGVIRNALAILSNSQLNALGLAAFLARCHLLGAPLVILDDPVPSSDREHRSTFASSVVSALLDHDRQVLLTTHDSELARHLHISHQHRGVDEFEAALVDPRDGTQLVRTDDDFERCMLDANSQMYTPLVANRRAAGNSLRIAAERLAKHVVVAGRRRDGNAAAAVSEFDHKNLKDLRPKAAKYALGPAEPGQWQTLALILNDADHDATPPTSTDLVHCHGLLRRLRKDHGQRDHDLMRL